MALYKAKSAALLEMDICVSMTSLDMYIKITAMDLYYIGGNEHEYIKLCTCMYSLSHKQASCMYDKNSVHY